jgi:uncharacterized membrane protein YgcG
LAFFELFFVKPKNQERRYYWVHIGRFILTARDRYAKDPKNSCTLKAGHIKKLLENGEKLADFMVKTKMEEEKKFRKRQAEHAAEEAKFKNSGASGGKWGGGSGGYRWGGGSGGGSGWARPKYYN